MPTVLITGATSGIGLSIANLLHNNGFKVYGTSRTSGNNQKSFPFEILELDITSEASIQKCIDTLMTKTKTIDALINNAGIGICGSAEETTLEQAYRQVETNFWGAVKMTRALLPHMRQQHYGKIIAIGSLAGQIPVPFQSYYAASKHALEGFFKTLRIEIKSFNIKISIVEPGFFKTNLHNTFEYASPSIADYDRIRDNALKVFTTSIERSETPERVAGIILRILNSKNPRFSYRMGENTKLAPLLQFLSYRLMEYGIRKKFGL
jgi:NAD(P)-dependent dehydrogenase (short-subunit alcohol dehydrogenase family)